MRSTATLMGILFCMGLLASACSTGERPATDLNLVAEAPMETQVILDQTTSPALPEPSETPRDVQERGVQLPQQLSSGLPQLTAVLGPFLIRTSKGYPLTAINGGGSFSGGPAIITAATLSGPWERFKIVIPPPHGQVYDKAIQTANGNFVTPSSFGGALRATSTRVDTEERFHLTDLSASHPSFYAIQTAKGTFLTAVDGGGRYEDAIHADATTIGDWERFRIVSCGAPMSGHEYGIMAANGQFLSAVRGGGESKNGIFLAPAKAFETKFKLIRQADGFYAFQTANGRNYVTAIDGGGHVQNYYPADCGTFSGACIDGYSDLFHTDATQVKAWEKFGVVDLGNCFYSIVTTSGFHVGIYKGQGGTMYLTTRRDGTSTANEIFQLVLYGLGSP